MKIATLISAILLAVQFLVFGLNGFLNFIPVPEFHPFMEILVRSGYIYLIKSFEIIGAVLLLIPSKRFAGYLILSPIIVNIVAYHIFLDHRNMFVLVTLLVPFLLLTWVFRNRLQNMLELNRS